MCKKFFTAAILAILSLPVVAQSEGEEPIITFRTNLYEEDGEVNTFTLAFGAIESDVYVDIDCGYGAEELKVGVARLEDSGEMGGSFFTGKVSKEGIVRVYGDPTKIDYFNASGSGITDIQFHKDLALQILNLEYNSLKTLNVDQFKNLQVLWLCDNPFTSATPLLIGKLEKLLILDIDQVGYVSPDFDLKNFPALMSFSAYHALTLKKADTSKCPNLVSLSLDMTAVESIDVSTNEYLSVLNVADTRVKSFDITKNARLTELYMGHSSGTINTDIKVDSVDLSGNPLLYILYAPGNNLKKLDISKNPELMTLSVPYNYIESLDVSQNPDLYSVNLSYNCFGFSTLPADNENWFEYYYQQRDIELPDYIKVGTPIDLSAKVLRPGSVTLGRAYYFEKSDPTQAFELGEEYYTYADGIVTFHKPFSKQIFIEYANSDFTQYNLRTEAFTVLSAADYGKDIKAVEFASGASTGEAVNLTVGIVGASAENPVKINVDFGDGELKSYTITEEVPAAANITGTREGYQNFAVYVPMGNYVSALSIRDINITNIQVSDLTELRSLELVNTGLYSIDLAYNANLQHLDLSGNNLKSLSLKGASMYFYKSRLTNVNISNNELATLEVDDVESLHYLDISHNKFQEFDLSDADNLVLLKASDNQFSTMLLSNSELVRYIDLSNNNLTTFEVDTVAELEYLNLSGNLFTLADMPESHNLDAEHFIYAPQQAIKIATSSPGVNLSSQYVTIGGESTQFVWKRVDGGSYVEGVDYTISNGSTKFINTKAGKVYCEIKHPAYPAFEGENVLRTTEVTPIDMPQIELASFYTVNDGDEVTLSLASSTDGTSVYFDWAGDGNVSQYTLGTTYTRFYETTKANTKVRVLVAEESDKFSVFSITGATMSSIDLSKMTDVPAITIADAGLESINLPASNKLNELNLSGNNLTSFDISKYPNLIYLSLNGNSLKSLDLSAGKELQLAYLGNNKLTSLTMNNPALWNLDVANNKFESISLTGCPNMNQIWVTSNQLSELDITPIKNSVQVLNVVDNKFRFSTLPRPTSRLNVYSYGNQAAVVGKVVDGKVDFSAEAAVGDSLTTFRWFVGEVEVDENDELVGEELYIDEEYSIVNGVTTFHLNAKFTNLVCIMTNGAYPNLVQYTDYITFDPNASGIQEVQIHTISTKDKALINNQILIRRNEKTYNALGAELK